MVSRIIWLEITESMRLIYMLYLLLDYKKKFSYILYDIYKVTTYDNCDVVIYLILAYLAT